MKSILGLVAACMLAANAFAAEPVNVNTATAQQLAENLKGIGASKAELIIAYREANGAFAHVDELVNVKGIGIKTIDQNRGLIRVTDDSSGGEP